MKRVFLAVLALLLLPLSCLAQSDLVLYDADDDRMGALVGFAATEVHMFLRTTDGYILKVDDNGILHRSGVDLITHFHYKSNDCTGQPYIVASGPMSVRGGQIAQMGDNASEVFVKVEWTPTKEEFSSSSGLSVATEVCSPHAPDYPVQQLIPATPVNPIDYGIGWLEVFSAYGFRLPFTAKIEGSDTLFCDGFESCPAQP